jgi:hypothetical protein
MRLLLLSLPVMLAATEIHLEIPQPVPVGQQVSGQLHLVDVQGSLNIVDRPHSPDWQLELRTSQRSSNTQIVNGKRTDTISYGLVFTALKPGPHELGAFVFQSDDGTQLQSEPLTVQTFQVRQDLRGDCIAEVSFEPERIVPGEPCTMRYQIYLNQRNRLNINSIGVSLPENAIELGERQDETIAFHTGDGTAWLLATLSWRFTMSQPGSYPVSGQQSYGYQERDFFRQRFQQTGVTAVKPAQLIVEALPSAGRPAEFSGLVGKATITAELERNRIAAGEGTRLLVTIQGRQLDLMTDLPKPSIPGVQVYEHDSDQPNSDSERHFAWDLVPAETGSYRIEPLTLSWFDASSRSYQTATSSPLQLEVLPGRQRHTEVVGTRPSTDQDHERPQPVGPQLPGPLHGESPSPVAPNTVLLFGLIGLTLGGGIALMQRLATRGPKQVDYREQARRALQADDLPAANSALARLRHQVPAEQTRQIDHLLTAVEQARFGGSSLDQEAKRLAEEVLA